MSLIERISAHVRNPPSNEDGEPFVTKPLPGLSAEDTAAFERSIGCKLSPETRELLSYCGGFDGGAMECVNFKGTEAPYVPKPLAGRILEISPDGYGNFWFYWAPGITPDLGPIYYYDHEGPVLVYQTGRLIHFVDEYLKFMTPPYASLIDDIHEYRLKPHKNLNLDLISKAAAVSGADKELATFAQSLPEDAQVYDFRSAKPGDGVDLRNLNVVAAHPSLPIIGLQRPSGWIRRLFS